MYTARLLGRVACISTTLFTVIAAPATQASVIETPALEDSLSVWNDTRISTQTRIVGGQPVAVGTYPFYARSSVSFNGQLCGATLIHDDILLTAAHCQGAFLDGVWLGDENIIGNASSNYSYFVSVAFDYPNLDYDDVTRANDIMLVKLHDATSATIARATLNFNASLIPVEGNDILTVAGFGATAENGDISQSLLDAQVTAYDDAICDALYTVYEPDTMICAGTEQGGRDACQGDSGGPLLLGAAGHQVQVGIISKGGGCGQANVPAVYTEVAAFAPFIQRGICCLSDWPPSWCGEVVVRENPATSGGAAVAATSGAAAVVAAAATAATAVAFTCPPAPAPTSAPTYPPYYMVPDERSCYTSLSDIVAIVPYQATFCPNVFNLCPNTIFTIGETNATNHCCFDGDVPLRTSAYLTVQCGFTGESSNNCTILGGANQLMSLGRHQSNETAPYSNFKGITFANADDISILLMTDGEFLFEDCIFINHTSHGVIRLAHNGQVATDLGLADDTSMYPMIGLVDPTMLMSDGNLTSRMRVSFHNCLFAYNGPSPTTEASLYGIIVAETSHIDVIVSNSIFLNNAIGDATGLTDTTAIRIAPGSTLETRYSCFLNNNFVGRGAVLVDAPESIVGHGSDFATSNANLNCQFIHIGGTATPCLDFAGSTCMAEKYDATMENTNPTGAPNSSPASAVRQLFDSTTIASIPIWLLRILLGPMLYY